MGTGDGDVLSGAPHQRIAELDPLGAAAWLAHLPGLNREADVPGLVRTLRAILPPVERAAHMDPFDAAAATRDLGMLLASLMRHGVEPVEAVPEIEAVMLRLGATTGMVPRETVLHYSLWNPPGARQRSFTGGPSEAGLIDAIRQATPWIEAGVDLLAQARALAPTTSDFTEACEAAAHKLEQLAEAMKVVRARVDPLFFATCLRPYFESIRLGDRRYSGAAAAPLGVGMVDHLLWSSDCADPHYREFQTNTMQYALPAGKRLYRAILGRSSIVTRFVAARDRGGVSAQQLAGAAGALDGLFKVLLAFRSRHAVVAKTAYAEKIRRYPVGSAGYGVETLMDILQLTKDARRRVVPGAEAAAYDVIVAGTTRTAHAAAK
jgi:hypothetical protein